MTKAEIFFLLGGMFIGGIFLSRYLELSLFWELLLVDLSLVLIFAWWKVRNARLAGFCLLFFILGIFRYEIAVPRVDENWAQFYNEKEKVGLSGIVISEPDIRIDKIKLTLGDLKLKEANNLVKDIKGKILITVERYPEFKYGDELDVVGQLKDPGEFDEFNYRDYLARYGIYSVVYKGRVSLLSSGNGRWLLSKILLVKGRFKKTLSKVIAKPQSSFLEGMLLGNKRGIPDDLIDKFSLTGISHIIVISGFHVTIVFSLLLYFGMLFLSRRQAFWLAVAGLLFFVVVTGIKPSAIRASVMGGLVLVALNFSRMSNVRNVLLFAAWIMLLANPKLLAFDIGFQLSFLATMGIVYFGPILQKYLKFIPETGKIREMASVTLSAQFLVIPIILQNFERVSLVAPITNILILPVIPWTMMFGFLAGLLGMIWTILGRIVGFAVWILLSYEIGVVKLLAKIPLASLEVNKIWIGWILVYYIIVMLLYLRFLKGKKS